MNADSEQLLEPEEPQLPFWARAIAWLTGMLGALILTFGGVTSFVTNILSPRGIIGAVLKLLLAMIIICLESPFCCPSKAKFFSDKIGKIHKAKKGFIYCFGSIIIFYLLMNTQPLTTILELLLPFACGVMYGLMSLGLKADKEKMKLAARDRMSNFDPTDLHTI